MSVPKICTGMIRRASSVNSTNAIAIEYGSSPVLHPSDQIRSGSAGARCCTRRGKTTDLSTANASGVRKKDVTLMRMS